MHLYLGIVHDFNSEAYKKFATLLLLAFCLLSSDTDINENTNVKTYCHIVRKKILLSI